MKPRDDLRRLLRWYPTNWRERYGDELLALLEDQQNDATLTTRARTSVAMAGLRERCYGSGLVGERCAPSTQRRTGSLVVMVAWSLMIVGGASLAKMAEHFSGALSPATRTDAVASYSATAIAGAAGTMFVVLGALVAIPGFVRLLRANMWTTVRRPIVRSLIASAALVAGTVSLAAWAHHLNIAQRNGADALYSGVFVAFALLVVLVIGLWTRAGVVVASKIDFNERELKWESLLALAVSFSSIVVVASAISWWAQIGAHAPWFLHDSAHGVSASPWTVRVVATVLVMGVSSVIALWGGARVALTYRRPRVNMP